MKTIGIIGGVGWAATIPAYEWINREVARRLGASHSARIILYSVDYQPFKELYHHGWDKIPKLFAQELDFALGLKPDCLLLACNTLHKAYDMIEDGLNINIPFFHAVRLTRDYLRANNVEKTLFLGTSFTMSDDYFLRPLREAGIEVLLPETHERALIQEAQSQLAAGKTDKTIRDMFQGILNKYSSQGCKNVVLACTELPLAIDETITSMRIINPLELQCRAAVDFILG